MSKIISAINMMVVNNQKITDCLKNGNEYFFIYNNKYKWSISKRSENIYTLYYYPSDASLVELAQKKVWEGEDIIIYNSPEFPGKEAFESFADLYRTLSEKAFGVDKVLEDILDDIPF